MIWKIEAAQCDGHHTNALFTEVAQRALLSLAGFLAIQLLPREMSAASKPRSRNLAMPGRRAPKKKAAFSIKLRNAKDTHAQTRSTRVRFTWRAFALK
jgi:hypothetical protein